MLTPDVRVEEFDAADWLALGDLFGRFRRRETRSRGLVILLDGGRVTRAVAGGTPIDPSAAPLLGSLPEAASTFGARWAVRADREVVPRLTDEFARRLARGDDVLAQTEKLFGVLGELTKEGAIETHPDDLRRLRARARLARRLADAICPPGKTALFAAFEKGDVRTSVALHRGDRGFDRIVGPALARGELGLVSGDWKRDSSRLARAIELGVGPLSIGCFAELHVWQRLVETATPGAWASAVAAREILFHPVAPAVAIPLGVDVGRAAVAAAREILSRFGVPPLMDETSPLRPALERVRDFAGSAEMERRLGFDPFAVLAELFAPARAGRGEGDD